MLLLLLLLLFAIVSGVPAEQATIKSSQRILTALPWLQNSVSSVAFSAAVGVKTYDGISNWEGLEPVERHVLGVSVLI